MRAPKSSRKRRNISREKLQGRSYRRGQRLVTVQLTLQECEIGMHLHGEFHHRGGQSLSRGGVRAVADEHAELA